MKKEELEEALIRMTIMRILRFLIILSLLVMISTPFVWIWHSADLCFKVGFTGFFSLIIVCAIYSILKKAIKEVVDEYEEPKPSPLTKSKFQEKLDQMYKEYWERRKNNE